MYDPLVCHGILFTVNVTAYTVMYHCIRWSEIEYYAVYLLHQISYLWLCMFTLLSFHTSLHCQKMQKLV